MATYEMLWDCSSCGTPKLLGKTHRRCPHCGAPQDPTKRYFPPPGQEVPVEGHVFVGVDWRCAACETPNSRAADFCVNCGNPRDGNASVALVRDGALGANAPASPTSSREARTGARSRRGLWVAGAAGALVLAALLVTVFWTRETAVSITAHTWLRTIDVETLSPKSDSAWCSSMPGDAYNVSRHREVRSHRQIPDGETCHTERHDNGDGTFSTSNVCRTKYRSEPVYDDKCYYTVNRWQVSRTNRADGAGLSPGPSWPTVHLSRPGSCLGCEREGSRRETLTLAVKESTGKQRAWTCDVDDARWRRLTDGLRTNAKVRVVTGGIVCDSLR